jgi:predicted dehydrogenase
LKTFLGYGGGATSLRQIWNSVLILDAADTDRLQPARLAVVGAGFMGRLHAKAIVDSEVAALAAVVDVDPDARRLADAHGASYHASIEALLDTDHIDGFVVCLPDRAHVPTACALLEAGRAVLLEKPMADTLEGALRIAEAAGRGNARLLVAHLLRFDPRYANAAAAVAEGRLGEVLHLSSGRLGVRDIGRRLNGSSSVLFYLGVHDVDLIQWISGKRIVRVSSVAASKLMPSLGVDSEDVIVTNAELEDGVVAQLYAGWTLRSDTPSPINARTTVVGSDGALEVDVRDHGLRIHTSEGWELPDGLHWPQVHGRTTGDLAEQLRHFVVAVMRGEPFQVGLGDAVSTAAVNDAILRAVRTRRTEDVVQAQVAASGSGM